MSSKCGVTLLLLSLAASTCWAQGPKKGTVIYLHGAFDGGPAGVVSNSCNEGGKLSALAKTYELQLECPSTITPLDWDAQLKTILEIADKAPKPVFLAGHSLGGRAALLIGLSLSPKTFRAVAVVAPAIASGGLALAVADKEFDIRKASELITATSIPTMFVWGTKDIVVSFRQEDLKLIQKSKTKLVKKDASHIGIVDESAKDVMAFFKSNI